MKNRIFQAPDGSLKRMQPSPRYVQRLMIEIGVTEDQAVALTGEKLIRDNPQDFEGLPFIDIDEADIPRNYTDRHKWRLVGGKIENDLSVPDKDPPKKDLIEKITAAKNLDELKAALVEDATKETTRLKSK